MNFISVEGEDFRGRQNFRQFSRTGKIVVFDGCKFGELESDTVARGLELTGGRFEIRNCTFTNIRAPRARGLRFGSPRTTDRIHAKIVDCTFSNIWADSRERPFDADGLVVQGHQKDTRVTISGCKFFDCRKRAIKAQSTNVAVVRCEINAKGARNAIALMNSYSSAMFNTIKGKFTNSVFTIGHPKAIPGPPEKHHISVAHNWLDVDSRAVFQICALGMTDLNLPEQIAGGGYPKKLKIVATKLKKKKLPKK